MSKRKSGGAPAGVLQHILVNDLRLDSENPRLPESGKPRSQDALVKLLADDYSLVELGRSLADNGFFSEEPLAAIRERKAGSPTYIVIEGNRRLAALKLLNDAALRRRLKSPEWDDIASRRRYDLSKVPVITYEKREDLLTFMGFRHITGVKPWEPLAKARFIHKLIVEHGMSFQEAARRIGSRANAIRQQFVGYRVYLQARDQFSLDVSKLEALYGVFTRAMSSAPLKEHIGINASKEKAEQPSALAKPVPAARARNLREFISWTVGTDDEEAVISDSREITVLGEVVAAPAALSLLRASRSLSLARQLTAGEEGRLLEHLSKASFHLDEALKDAHRHKGVRQIAVAAQRCQDTIVELRRALGK